jgi:DNA-binding MarR family transcriptional regulator
VDKLKIVENIQDAMPVIHKKILAGISMEGLTNHQTRLLMMIRKHEGRPMKFYGNKMLMSKSNFSNLVESLIVEDLVVRKKSQEDRRLVNLFISEKGKDTCNMHRSQIKEYLLDKMDSLTDEELEILEESFENIRRILKKI